jgi:membrane-associated phospholipid phosphatase
VLTASWVLALSLTIQSHAASTVPPNSEWSDDQPFTHIIQNLGTDFGNLPTSTNAAIAGVGALGAIAVHRYDAPIAAWVTKQPASSYTKFGNFTGNGFTEAGLAIGTYAIGKLTHDDEAIHMGSDFIRGQLLNGIFTEALKFGVNRTRPTGSNHSFPSGHTSATFTTAAILEAHFGWAVGAAAYAAGGFVGWCRIRDNQHFLTDVIVGAAVGIVSGHTVTAGHHRPRQVQVMPSLTPDGGPAVLVIWTPARR